MVQLQRAGRLLRQVSGKPHASSDDHHNEAETHKPMTREEEEEALIHADPVSSDEEVVESSPQIPPSEASAITSKSSNVNNPAKQGKSAQTFSEKNRQRNGKSGSMAGTYTKRQVVKLGTGQDDDEKENASANVLSTQTRIGIEDGEETDIMFDWSQHPQKRRKTSHATPNIHTNTGKIRPANKKFTYQSKKSKAAEATEDDLTDFSDSSLEPLPEQLQRKQRRRQSVRAVPALPEPQASKPERTSILDTLAQYRHHITPTTSQISDSHSNTHGKYEAKESAVSTPLSSLDSLEPSLEEYIHVADGRLSGIVSEDKCPLCEEPVEPEYFREFWQSRKMNVRQQSIFCHDHRKRAAEAEYEKLGYPTIDWDRLPSKIEEHYAHLMAIVRNEADVPSTYRNLYAERAEAGERQQVSKMIEENTTAMAKTGYYGARGHRMFMESITDRLSDVIRECAVEDSTVAHGGMANFVLHVLVPELTIRLVMDESSVSEGMARQIIDESGEIGAKVHEEQGDIIKNMDSEDEES